MNNLKFSLILILAGLFFQGFSQGPPPSGLGGDGCAIINGFTTICIGETTTLTASGGTTYNWSNGSSSASTTVGAGTYTVTVTGGGCNSTVSVTVSEDANCTSKVFQLCQTVNSATIAPDRNNYAHDVSGEISEAYLLNFSPPTPPSGVCNLALGALDISIEIFDINDNTAPDCDFYANFGNVYIDCNLNQTCDVAQDVLTSGCDNFGVGQDYTGTATMDLVACNPGDATVSSVIGVDLVPAMAFLPGCPSNTSAITDGLIDINYTICLEYTYTFAPDLTADLQADFSINCPQEVTLGNDPILGIEGVNYNWSSGQSGTLDLSGGGQDHGQITVTPITTTTYTVTLTDTGSGCTGTNAVTVTVGTGPSLDAGLDASICGSGSATIGGDPVAADGLNYTWSSGQSGTTSPTDNGQQTVSPGTTTTYTVTVTDGAGCSATDQVTITVAAPPTASIAAPSDLGCGTATVTLDASGSSSGGAITYSWSGPSIVSGGTTNAPVIDATGIYTITVTDTGSSCTATASTTVNGTTGGSPGFLRN